MTFPFNSYLGCFVCALLGALLSLPLWRRWCHGAGVMDDPGHRKIHTEPVPLAGGLAVMTGLLLPVLAGLAALYAGVFEASTVQKLLYGFGKRSVELSAILGGCLGMVVLGWLDDKYELSPPVKFAGQALIALVTAAAGVRVTLFVESALFSYAITVLWILVVTNAMNFMDNMNGLCAGLGIIASGWFGGFAVAHDQYLVASIALAGTGAMAGFLPYNFPKASAFLGDAGSHLIGYLLAVQAILPHFYSSRHPSNWAVLSPLLVLAVPLADLVWVVWLRRRSGKPVYVGDTNHLSHRLVQRGWTKPQAVLWIWLLGLACGSLTLLWP
jgi:UDP-GlcNAc:undecaprenyl-phosphate/decaprenyl-phosphate GlcNAc-1-phosphate transferase